MTKRRWTEAWAVGLALLISAAAPAAHADSERPAEPGEAINHQLPGERLLSAGRAAARAGTAVRPRRASAELGFTLLDRAFDFNEPLDPSSPSNYRSGVLYALRLQGELYPLAWLDRRGPLDGLGITMRYLRAVGLSSVMVGHTEPLDTTLQGVELGLRYRWNLLGGPGGLTLIVGVEFGWQEFTIHDDPYNPVPMPDITYQYLKLTPVGLELPLINRPGTWFGAELRLAYMAVADAGEMERNDSSGFGTASVGGVQAEVGLMAIYRGFTARLSYSYRRFFYDFDNACYGTTGCRAAGGALDIYHRWVLAFGYTL